MLLKTFYDRALAQASYMIGCQETGEALIIDPARDITPYLQAAEAENMRIVQVTETHIHADFVSGVREVAAQTGARMFLSGMGGEHWQYAIADANTTLLYDGDVWMVGNVRIEVIHTPGHTPEHLIFAITDTVNAAVPLALITGDCLFVGDMGRPDLLETTESEIRFARNDRERDRRTRAVPERANAQNAARLPANSARSRRGERVRQGARRCAIQHAWIRKAGQPRLTDR